MAPLSLLLADLSHHPLWLLLVVFGVAAAGVWFAGNYLSRWADVIADRTGWGDAFVGVLLLGGATGLPELVTSATAASVGNAAMAGGALLGAIAMQLTVLACVDGLFVRRGALTFFTPKPALLMQCVMLQVMLLLAIAAIAAGDRFTVLGVGGWSIALAACYLLGLWVIQRYEGNPRWQPQELGGKREAGEPPIADARQERRKDYAHLPAWRVWLGFAAAALGVLIGGYFVARTGDAISEKTGLGASIVGATLLALATSLPELSATVGAVRIGAYVMAVANIIGTNAFSVALLFVSDVFYRDGSLLNTLDHQASFLAALGAVLTCVYLWGLLERRDRTIFRFGYDSAAVLVLYIAGLVIFYFLGGEP